MNDPTDLDAYIDAGTALLGIPVRRNGATRSGCISAMSFASAAWCWNFRCRTKPTRAGVRGMSRARC